MVQPNSTIRLLKNVPLDKTYRNTIYFASAGAQSSYFAGKVKYTIANNSYVRVNENFMTVPYTAEVLYDCNYIMFQNQTFGTKWFYAFIVKVDYINEKTSKITFELDVMQSWHFDYTLQRCLVTREHVMSDNKGQHTVPENLELGDYIYYTQEYPLINSTMRAIVAVTEEPSGSEPINVFIPVRGAVYEGVFSGCALYTFDTVFDGEGLSEFLQAYVENGRHDAIIAIYMVLEEFVGDTIIESGLPVPQTVVGRVKHFSRRFEIDNLDGYVPKNNKMFTSPYMYAFVHNNNGGSKNLRFEDNQIFSDFEFDCYGTVLPNPVYKLVVTNTKNNTNKDNSITLSGFPMCSWPTNSYEGWLINNAGSIVVSALGAVGGIAVTGGAGAALLAGGGLLTGNLARFIDRTKEASRMEGTLSSATLNASYSQQDFYISVKGIKQEYARIVDNYFELYGYKVNTVKVPNVNGRPHWNYVETAGCNAIGSVPADDMRKILSVYDKGITFWKNGNNVGNYTLDNSIG